MSTSAGRVLSLIGIVFAVIDRLGQVLGGVAIILCVLSIGVSGLEDPPH